MSNEPFNIEPPRVGQLPRVTVSVDKKINLGNYESFGIFISLSDDIAHDFENPGALESKVSDTFNRLTKMLEQKEAEVKSKAGIGGSVNVTEEVTKPSFKSRFGKK